MRIVIAQPGPDFSVQDVYAGWVEALRGAGVDVHEFNLSKRLMFYDLTLLPTGVPDVFRKAVRTDTEVVELAVNGLYAALYKVRPDVLLVVSGFFIPTDVYELCRANGTRIVIVHTEEPYEHERELALAAHADLNVINDPTNLAAFQAVAPSVYIPHSYRPTLHHPGPPMPAMVCDFAFAGTGYPSRIAFFEEMGFDGLDVLLAGNWQALAEDSPLRRYIGHDVRDCIDNAEAADLYRSAQISMNLYRREATDGGSADGWAMGPREIEMAACGLFFLRDPRGEGDEVLSMLPTFTGPRHAADLIRWWLHHPDERDETARKARAAIADRTFDNAAAEVLRLLDK